MDFVKTNRNLTANFLPTFTSYYGKDRGTSTNRSSSLASEWIHEYDDRGRLVKSSFFELYPYRILKEVTYMDIVDDHKLTYRIEEYGYYGLLYSYSQTYELTFNDDFYIETIGHPGTVLKVLNDKGWATKISTVAPNGTVVYQTGYKYDQHGNILNYISYNNPGVANSTVDYTYNQNGDPLSYHYQNTEGVEIKAIYYYNENNVLERLEEEYYHSPDDFGSKVYTYTSKERLSKQVTNRGDGSREVVTYTEDKVVEEFFKDEDVLTEVYVYEITDQGYFLKLHKKYREGVLHTIKYYNADEKLIYTEYYHENGELLKTVYS